MLCSRMLIFMEEQAKALEKARDMRDKSISFLERGQVIQGQVCEHHRSGPGGVMVRGVTRGERDGRHT